MRGDAEETPLQIKLNHLAELIAKAGAGAGLTLFTALMIRFFVQLATMPNRYVLVIHNFKVRTDASLDPQTIKHKDSSRF